MTSIISVASIYRPTFSIIKEPYYNLGVVTIRKILKGILGEPLENQKMSLPLRLIKSESCKKN